VNNRGDVVVGYDGSATARRAVEFAAAEADTHDTRLRIISVWNKTPTIPAIPPVALPVAGHNAELAARQLDEATGLARDVAPELEIEALAIEGNPGAELAHATENSRLLVVGCRGRGSVHRLVLGSVSHYCTLHARCPVLVVPTLVDERPPVSHRSPGTVR
jgi:nucleotide-binding universal stress UspA family protein